MKYSNVLRAYELRKIAEQQGNQEVVEKLDSLMASVPQDNMSREGRINYEEAKEDQLEYRDRLTQRDRIKELRTIALSQGNEDAVAKLDALGEHIDKDIFDHEDVTEEIVGTSLALSEGLTLGIVGDESFAKLRSTVTGEDYDTALSETRRIEREFAEDHRGTDLAIRVGAGLIPSVRLAKMAGIGTSGVSGAARQAGVTGAEIATYSFAEGEGGVKDRLQNVGQTLTDPLAVGAMAVAGGFGGLGGRAVKQDMELQANLRKAVEAEEERLRILRESKGALSGTSVVGNVQKRMDELVVDHYNQTGKMPEGLEIGQLYKQVAEEFEMPISRIMQSEMKAGGKRSDLDYRNQNIDAVKARVDEGIEYVSGTKSTEYRGFFSEFWQSKLESIVNVAKDRVGPQFAGAMQRMSVGMAQNQQAFDAVFASQPVQAFAKVMESDRTGRIRMELLNFSNTSGRVKPAERMEAFENFKRLLTEEQFAGFQALQKVRLDQAGEYRKYVLRELDDDPLYFPSQVANLARQSDLLKRRGLRRSAADMNSKEISRDKLTNYAEALEYENPLVVMRDKLVRDNASIEMHKAFKLQNNSNRLVDKEAGKQVKKDIETGQAGFTQLRTRLSETGASPDTATTADELMRSMIVHGVEAPDNWLANMRKAAYMGTIGNPYSAFLNFGDVSNTVVNFGPDNTLLALREFYKKNGLVVGTEDIGILQQSTGEFLREGSKGWQKRFDKINEATFQYSGFRSADRAGKTVTLTAAVKLGQKKAVDGSLIKEYEWLFGPQGVRQLRSDLIRNKKTQRVKEFAAAELGKLQPSDMAQMPKWYLDHPNGRLLYMLRTFGIKQLQQVNRLVVEQAKRGNKKEAAKNALAYIAIVGGGNTLLHELRQPIKTRDLSDVGDVERMQTYFTDFFLGLATLNIASKYGLEKASQGDAGPLIRAAMPAPVDMVDDISSDLAPLLTGDKDLEEILVEGDGVKWAPYMRTIQPILEDEL